MSIWSRLRLIYNATFGAGNEAFWRQAGWLPGEGTSAVTPDTVLGIAGVWKAVNTIGKDIATLPLHKYQRLEPTGKNRVRDDVVRLLNQQANVYIKAMDLRLAVEMQALLVGNGYAEIQRDLTGKPLALWWLPSELVTPKIDEAGFLFYELKQSTREPRRIRPENVLHIKGPAKDAITGWSVVTLARESLSLTMGQETYARKQYENGVRPSMIIKKKGIPSAEQRKEFREEMSRMHEGSENAFRFMLLYGDTEASPWSMSNEDAQWLEGRQFQIEEIARWFDLPPHKLGAMGRATWSNVEQMQMEYVGGCLNYWLRQWESEANAKLLTEREKLAETNFYEFKTEALLRGDTLARYQVYAIGIANKILNPNECRDKENMNPYEGGDEYANPNTGSPNAAGDPTDRREEQDDGNRHPRSRNQQRLEVLAETETQLVLMAAERSKNFTNWVEHTYAEGGNWHAHVVEVFASCELPQPAADRWCQESRDSLLGLTETVTQRELSGAVVNLLADWPLRANEFFCLGASDAC